MSRTSTLPSLEKEAGAVNVCSYSMEAAGDAKQLPEMDIGDSEVVCRRTPNGNNPLAPQRDAGPDSPLSLDYEACESDTLGDFRDLKEFPKMDICNSEVVCRRTPNGKNPLTPPERRRPGQPPELRLRSLRERHLGGLGTPQVGGQEDYPSCRWAGTPRQPFTTTTSGQCEQEAYPEEEAPRMLREGEGRSRGIEVTAAEPALCAQPRGGGNCQCLFLQHGGCWRCETDRARDVKRNKESPAGAICLESHLSQGDSRHPTRAPHDPSHLGLCSLVSWVRKVFRKAPLPLASVQPSQQRGSSGEQASGQVAEMVDWPAPQSRPPTANVSLACRASRSSSSITTQEPAERAPLAGVLAGGGALKEKQGRDCSATDCSKRATCFWKD
ncbi:uncharacterized protein LOC128405849 [Podarcis raffonei]|uniref:uncharacterized protein LOC128405849 n=1 Tax=Podarcis raffonei TaxID=65483 RepID=UPI0023296883|nr:uncharacterized protein LOC128405849 [Podarcis raffonei]